MSTGEPSTGDAGLVNGDGGGGRVARFVARARPVLKRARWVMALVPVVLLGVAIWTLYRELSSFHFRDLKASLHAIPNSRVAAALGVTALNYLLLTCYDALALRHVGKPLPYPRVGFTSFLAYAFGHNIGFAVVSGGSIRYRMYSSWGLSALEVTHVIAFCGLTFWVGLLATGGMAFLLSPVHAPGGISLPFGATRAVGVVLVVLTVGYVVLAATLRKSLTLGGHEFRLPRPGVALGQVLVSGVDWMLAALVLYLLLPPEAGLSPPALVTLFIVAQVAGLVSQVPGGLGVFESVVLAALTPRLPAPTVLGLLVVYRIVYYLVPFTLAVVLLAGNELLRRRERISVLLRGAHASFAPVVPMLAAASSFVGGTVLLLSGATPTVAGRLSLLQRLVPLPLLELSHFLGSLCGVGLLLLARGLQRRLDAAYVLAVALLTSGMVLSVFKGIDYEEAVLLGVLLLALLPFRSQFYRHASLIRERFTPGWVLAVALVVGTSVWLGFFSYKHVEYSGELWWRFTFFGGDAPRFLRASAGVVGVAFLFGVAQLLSPAAARPVPPTEEELALARPLIARSPDSASHLALIRDKALLFNDSNTAFLMYGVEGRSWVVMGDPVGPEKEATELAWRFRELADKHHGWTCFYQVGPRALPRYLDLGLALLKLGEEATVPLEDFSLEGPERRTLRHSHRQLEKKGLSFEMVPPEGVAPLMPELRRVSDAWLSEKNTREKGFSLGSFDERYLKEGPVALIRQEGKLVGFANLWTSETKEELSVDLMRYGLGAPHATMEYLFVSLMLWGREQGYGRFNLGMAPFSGFQERDLAPLWNRVGALVFRYGEHFYNFQGLRQYKEKFRPEWTPRYLAAPGGLALPRVLANIAALVSRGITGVVTR